MKSLVLNIDPVGTVHCLHTDLIPLETIGRQNIERASFVEFNQATQLWEVRLAGSATPDFVHISRAACIAWEIETITNRLMGELIL